MIDVFVGLLILAHGLVFGFFCRRLGRATNEFYESMNWSHVSERWIIFSFGLGGAIFSIFGILLIFGIINV
jgi:hypothetical protein